MKILYLFILFSWSLYCEGQILSIHDVILPVEEETLQAKSFTYLSDSVEVEAMLLASKYGENLPVIIFNRGGNRMFSSLNLEMLMTYTSVLAKAGYIILASNYRKEDEFGGADVHDILNLIAIVPDIEQADPGRIGMFGWSRGGMMTYLCLKESTEIKTAVIGNAPTDLTQIAIDRPNLEQNVFAQCIPNYWENKEEELKKRSVKYWFEELNNQTSLLLVSGVLDQRVDANQSQEIYDLILSKGNQKVVYKPFETDHFFSDSRSELNDLIVEWFSKEL